MITYSAYEGYGRQYKRLKITDDVWIDTAPVRIDLGSDATGDMYYRNSNGFFVRLGIGSAGQVLKVVSGLPAWQPENTGGGETYAFSTGLTDSDNTITANISTGTAGGQTAIGGTGAGENLTLSSTAHTTKGAVITGDNLVPATDLSGVTLGLAAKRFSTVYTAGINSVGSDLALSSSTGSVVLNTASTVRAKLFNSGNIVFQNGGAFTDAGYRVDIQGTLRTTGAVTHASLTSAGLKMVTATAAGVLGIADIPTGGSGITYTAGAGIEILEGVISNTITNNNQLTNGAGYITTAAHTHTIANSAGTSQFTFAIGDAIRFEGINGAVVSFTSGSKKITIDGGGVGESYTFSTGLTDVSNVITADLSTGVSGGQAAIGGTGASENLTLSSTAHATKGTVITEDSLVPETDLSGVTLGLAAKRFSSVYAVGVNSVSSDLSLLSSTGGILLNTAATVRAKLFNSGNIVFQNGGTFTDAGYRMDIQGTLRTTGAVTHASLASAGIKMVTASAAGVLGISDIPSGGTGVTYVAGEGILIEDGVISATVTAAHTHGISNSAGVSQFTFGIGESIRFEGINGAAVTFTPGSKKVTIDGGGASVSYTFSTGLTNASGTVTANLSTGIAGGQSVIGGVAASENLTLLSTTHATKGNIILSNNTIPLSNNTVALGSATQRYSGVFSYVVNSGSAALDLKSTASHVQISSNNTERLRITGTGSVIVQNGGTFTDAGYLMDVRGTFRTSGENTFTDLAGTGVRMVVADAAGVLATQAVPVYTAGPGITINGGVISSTVSVAHTHTIANAAGTSQFTFAQGEAIRFEAINGAAVTFTSASKKITIDGGAEAYIFSTGLTNAGGTITSNLSTGIAGGQSVIGGVGASENLTLLSTTNATKGNIILSNNTIPLSNNAIALGSATQRYSGVFTYAVNSGAAALELKSTGGHVHVFSNNTERLRVSGTGSVIVQNGGTFTDAGYLMDVRGTFRTNGVNTLSNLSGTGTRMVVADATGILSTQTVPVGGGTYTAGAGISISGTNVISNTITNNNQIANGAGYITSAAHTHSVGNSGGTSQFTFAVGEMIRFAGGGGTTVAFNAATKQITFSSNTGISYTAGAGITISSAGVIANTITNNNQLTNGAGYITTAAHTHVIANSGGTSQFTFAQGEAIRFAGANGNTISFNASTKTVTITAPTASGGATYSAGTGIAISTSNVISNTITNNNQLANGAGYITSVAHVHTVANAAGTSQFTFAVGEALRFEGVGGASVSFTPATKKITISGGAVSLTHKHIAFGIENNTVGSSPNFVYDTGTVFVNAGTNPSGGYSLDGTSNPSVVLRSSGLVRGVLAVATSSGAYMASVAPGDIVLNASGASNSVEIGSGAGTSELSVGSTGTRVASLTGTGTRMVVATAAGVLATQAIPTPVHTHSVGNAAGTSQFSFGVGETVRFEPLAGATISFVPANKTVQIGLGPKIRQRAINYIIDTGDFITAGKLRPIALPNRSTITAWRVIVDDNSHDSYITIDVRKVAYASWPTTVSMVGTGLEPATFANRKGEAEPSGWTTTVLDAKDELEFEVKTVNGLMWCVVTLFITEDYA